MKIEFLAHAGIHIESEVQSILIDPWFTSSSFSKPVLHALLPGAKTIDFQIPAVVTKIEDYRPTSILLSHFHTHHSPLAYIQTLIKQGRNPKTTLAFPKENEATLASVQSSLPELVERTDFHSTQSENKLKFGKVKDLAIRTPAPNHLAWFIKDTDTKAFCIRGKIC